MTAKMPSSTESVDLPPRLTQIQGALLRAREEGALSLRHGDTGFGSAPSNIALIKYWGKETGRWQRPLNANISFTLGGFRSFTKVMARGMFVDETTRLPFANTLSLGGKSPQPMPEKMDIFVRRLLRPWAPEIALHVESTNNFPTACGIASSASGYAALVAAIADLIQADRHLGADDIAYWMAEWARLGSGSATRSALASSAPSFVSWEPEGGSTGWSATTSVPAAQGLAELRHLVLIVSGEEKSVTSSEGHATAASSPLHGIRLAGLPAKFSRFVQALAEGDFHPMRYLSEEDAFAMHAVMQTSKPAACYLKPETTKLIERFVALRDSHGAPALWTLDAGPNLHLLFLPEAVPVIRAVLQEARNLLGPQGLVLVNRCHEGLVRGKLATELLAKNTQMQQRLLLEHWDKFE